MIKNLLHRKIVAPIKGLLVQGVSPETLSLSLACGFVIACLPLLGVTTVLCICVAAVFRLNHVAIQVANYLAYPAQFLLIVPLMRLGGRLFHDAPIVFDAAQMTAAYQEDFAAASHTYMMAGLHGVAAWAAVAPVAIYVLYITVLPFMQDLSKKFAAQKPPVA
jgi:uncharacterized protein (DUF2062 family)